MLEFIFFHPTPLSSFVAQLDSRNLTYTTHSSELNDEYEAHIEEDIADQLLSEIEVIYDQLMEESQQLLTEHGEGDAANYSLSSITITLADGTITHAEIPAALLTKIVQVISPQEFGDIVNAIADAVKNPDSRNMCQRVRDGAIDGITP